MGSYQVQQYNNKHNTHITQLDSTCTASVEELNVEWALKAVPKDWRLSLERLRQTKERSVRIAADLAKIRIQRLLNTSCER
jgi:hypothetical protein